MCYNTAELWYPLETCKSQVIWKSQPFILRL